MITVKVVGEDDPVEVGQLELYRFVNPAGLQAIGQNLFKITALRRRDSGQPGMNGMAAPIRVFWKCQTSRLWKRWSA